MKTILRWLLDLWLRFARTIDWPLLGAPRVRGLNRGKPKSER